MRPGGVEATDPVRSRETASGQHEAGAAPRDLKGDPGRDRRTPAARREHGVDSRHQVAAGVSEARIARHGKVAVQAYQRYLQHESAP